jgi:hypothetical protein
LFVSTTLVHKHPKLTGPVETSMLLQIDVTRILGYTPADVDAESESEPEADNEEEEGSSGAMVLDREWIKMRAAKMVARHNAKQQAAAAAAAAAQQR